MRYLVKGSEGPGFTSADEALAVLEKMILPMFDALEKLEAEGRIIAGGLPVGDRAFVFIVEAESNQELDRLLRDLPAWGIFKWKVKPLQSVGERAAMERSFVSRLRGK